SRRRMRRSPVAVAPARSASPAAANSESDPRARRLRVDKGEDMRNALFVLVSAALLEGACEAPGPGDFKLNATGPIGGNGVDTPLAIEDGGITNGLLASPGITVMAGLGLTGGGPILLGGTGILGVSF